MNKVYLDVTELDKCVCVVIKDKEVIKAGITVYPMSSNEKNENYQQYADNYDIHFIFDDDIPKLSFYTVPQVDIFATDSEDGLIGSVGSMTDLESDSPICYISNNKKCFFIANSLKEFLEKTDNWKNNLKPYNEVVLYDSKLEAEKELRFINI
ncbi:hypothetical protein ACQPUZ_02750 [Clostridium tertium]